MATEKSIQRSIEQSLMDESNNCPSLLEQQIDNGWTTEDGVKELKRICSQASSIGERHEERKRWLKIRESVSGIFTTKTSWEIRRNLGMNTIAYES
jgi:hypothetical protein